MKVLLYEPVQWLFDSFAFARIPRAEARGRMARGDRDAARRAKSGASAQFRLALPRMLRVEARGASCDH
jgi:hypothetical protein